MITVLLVDRVAAFFDWTLVLLLAGVATLSFFVLNHLLARVEDRCCFFVDGVEINSLGWIKGPCLTSLNIPKIGFTSILKITLRKWQIRLLIPYSFSQRHHWIIQNFFFKIIFSYLSLFSNIIISRLFNYRTWKPSIICFSQWIVPDLSRNYARIINNCILDCYTFLHSLVVGFTVINNALTAITTVATCTKSFLVYNLFLSVNWSFF